MRSGYKSILGCCGINLLLFMFVLLFFHPIYGSGDDVLCLYLLSGGFGFEPTELIQYNHILNPLITLPVKSLFILAPNYNWYSLALIAFHFIATTVILKQMSSVGSFWKGILVYLVIFMVFEAQFLLTLSFTNTSIVLTWAALVVLFTSLNTTLSTWRCIVCISMFALASLFRIHIIFPIVAVVLPFLFFKKGFPVLPVVRVILVSALLIFLLNLFHQFYYRKNINGWAEREGYQQILYKYFNRGGLYDVHTDQWKTEMEMIKYSLLLDSNYLNSAKLTRMYEELTSEKVLWHRGIDLGVIKWLFINNRIYLFSFLAFLVYAYNKRLRIILLISVVSFALGVIFLILYFRLKYYIIPGSIGVICLSLFIYGNRAVDDYKLKWKSIKLAVMSFLIFWASVRLLKVNFSNKQSNLEFKNAVREVENNRSYLFFVQDFGFPYDQICVFDIPSQYKLQNVLIDWQYPESLSINILHSYNINSVKDIPYANNVLFWGKPVKSLLDYFGIITGKKVVFSPVLKEFKYAEVRRLQIVEQ